jgi:hypothetical protein
VKKLSVAVGSVGALAALWLAPSASADPAAPAVDAPAPAPAPAPDPLAFLRPAAPAPANPDPAPAAAPANPDPAPAAPAVAPGVPVPAGPDGVSHLASPDALPPGTTLDPSVKSTENPNVSYLRDLWQAVQNHDISGKQALIMGLAQRGMNTPYPQQAPGPNVPVAAADPVAPPAAPAPGAPAPQVPAPPAPALP